MARNVAILGASTHRQKFGNKSLRAHAHAGWNVFPVHRTCDEIEGLKAYPSLADLPETMDRITVYLPPAVTLSLLDELEAAGAKEIWLNPGAADANVLQAAKQRGLAVIDGCSIVDLGLSPSQFPA